MKGRVIVFDKMASSGLIESDGDRRNFRFSGGDWHGPKKPRIGFRVEFELDGERAVDVRPAGEAVPEKKKRSEGDEVRELGELPLLALGGVAVTVFVAMSMSALAAMGIGEADGDPLTFLLGTFVATVGIAVSAAGMVSHPKGLVMGGVGVIVGFYAWLVGMAGIMAMIPSVSGG